MANTNFLQFDIQQTNMLSDADYSSDAERNSGFVTGISRSILFNKTLFQASTMTTAIANVLVSRGHDAIDNNLASLQDSIDKSFSMNRGLPIGSLFPTTAPITEAPEGFLLPNGEAFDPSEYPELAYAYRIGTDTYKYGQLYVEGVWWPKTPDLRGYFLRVHNPRPQTVGPPDASIDGPDAGRTLGTSQESANLKHTHPMRQGGGHTHTLSIYNDYGNTGDAENGYLSNLTSGDTPGASYGDNRYMWSSTTNSSNDKTVSMGNSYHSHAIELDEGVGAQFESRPYNYALTYLIVAKNEANLSELYSASRWGNISGDISDQLDLKDALDAKQNLLTPGTGVSIVSDTISIVAMVGTDGTNAGVMGGVPAPSALDYNKYLCGDGTWKDIVMAMSSLSDISITSPSNGQVLVFNSSTQKWENGTINTASYDSTTKTITL